MTSLELLLETRSVSRAAERLSISQPAMSRALARLRDQFDDLLLVRGRGGMVLTPRAEALKDPLRRWLSQGETMLRPSAFDPGALKRTFRIASTDFGVISVIMPAMNGVSASSPGSTMAVDPLSTDSLKRLAEGLLDVVVTGFQPEGSGLHSRHLFRETHLGLARTGHPADLQDLTLEEFLQWPHVVALVGDGYADPVEAAFPGQDPRRVLASAASFSTIPYLVAGSDAVAVLPSRAALRFQEVHGHQTFDLPIRPAPFDYYLVWHERSLDDGPTRWLIDRLAASFPPGDAASRRSGNASASAQTGALEQTPGRKQR